MKTEVELSQIINAYDENDNIHAVAEWKTYQLWQSFRSPVEKILIKTSYGIYQSFSIELNSDVEKISETEFFVTEPGIRLHTKPEL